MFSVKTVANRRNARLSTGPRTAGGKLVSSRNAVRHGVWASAPVIPGEDPAAWDAHRAGILLSLAPAGLLEQALADRAALVLWRLGRLARYEALTTAADIEDAVLPEPAGGGRLDALLTGGGTPSTRRSPPLGASWPKCGSGSSGFGRLLRPYRPHSPRPTPTRCEPPSPTCC